MTDNDAFLFAVEAYEARLGRRLSIAETDLVDTFYSQGLERGRSNPYLSVRAAAVLREELALPKPCLRCGGKGWVAGWNNDELECERCGGTGKTA